MNTINILEENIYIGTMKQLENKLEEEMIQHRDNFVKKRQNQAGRREVSRCRINYEERDKERDNRRRRHNFRNYDNRLRESRSRSRGFRTNHVLKNNRGFHEDRDFGVAHGRGYYCQSNRQNGFVNRHKSHGQSIDKNQKYNR